MSVRYEGFPVSVGVFIDIKKANRLLRRDTGRKTHAVSVAKLHALLKTGYVGVNKHHAMNGPIQQTPLVMMQVAGIWCLIDGWHRVFQAKRWGRKFLRAYRLTPTEAKKCALPMTEWLRRKRAFEKRNRR